MTQMNYQTVFEIGFRSFPWVPIFKPLIFVAIGLLLIRFLKSRQSYLITGFFVVSLASVIFVVSLVAFILKFVNLRSSYVSGKSSIVEGVVEDFHPAPKLGPARESFSVRGVLFTYNVLDDTPCFHNAPVHGGPIRAGLEVRIYYDQGCIQRVDIHKEARVGSMIASPVPRTRGQGH